MRFSDITGLITRGGMRAALANVAAILYIAWHVLVFIERLVKSLEE